MIKPTLVSLLLTLALGSFLFALAANPEGLSPASQQRALAVLKDDCANCHGLYRLGGLGPKLTPQSLEKFPQEMVEVIIEQGVPGRFMPGWQGVLTKAEISFLAHYIKTTPPDPPKIQLRGPLQPQR